MSEAAKPKVKRVEAGYKQNRDERDLTERHRQVLTLMHQGLSRADAARELGITRSRVGAIVKELASRDYLKVEGRQVTVNVEKLIG